MKIDYLFSDIDTTTRKALQMDDVAEYSVSPPWMSKIICETIAKVLQTNELSITDGTACVGGDTIRFCQAFTSVNAVESDATRVHMLRLNVSIVGCADKVVIYHDSYLSVCDTLVQDVVYLDAPWGGPSYIDMAHIDLFLDGIPIVDVCARAWDRTRLIVLKVPCNFNMMAFKVEGASKLPRAQIVSMPVGRLHLLFIRKKPAL